MMMSFFIFLENLLGFRPEPSKVHCVVNYYSVMYEYMVWNLMGGKKSTLKNWSRVLHA